ncbi:short-chain dehydrogenase [Halobacteriales archaeon QH_8_67_27]|nr:MAG: short-chain dehydrogenase [Halobacteriales archaeon QH_8_67_27]
MDGTTIVVTGGTRGIGAASVRAFADAGAHVVTCARDADALAELAADIRDSGGTITAERADVRDQFDVERLLETAAREGGPVDVVVANAGVYHGDAGETAIDTEAYAAFDDTLRTNVRGVFTTFREAQPHLADDARLLVLSGRIAREPQAGFGAYAVSKAAAEAVARQFAVGSDAAVGVVDPGAVATELTGGQGMDPERAADLVLWAARDADSERLDGSVLDRRAMREA